MKYSGTYILDETTRLQHTLNSISIPADQEGRLALYHTLTACRLQIQTQRKYRIIYEEALTLATGGRNE